MGTLVAAVLTHRRPALAGRTVRHLVDDEAIPPAQIHVIVNGEGDVQDAPAGINLHRLPENLGPAGGMRAAMEIGFADGDVEWLYLCEDDVGGLDLPAPRTGDLIREVAQWEADNSQSVGAVVAYSRRLDRRTGTTVPHLVEEAAPVLVSTDLAAWGASLISRRVFDAGLLPRADMFFGYEDFDFFLSMQAEGLALLLDARVAGELGRSPHPSGRDDALGDSRRIDDTDPWRRYYEARNFLYLTRRHGRAGWYASHLAKSIRRAQLGGWPHRRAIGTGLIDGLLGRTGPNQRYLRSSSDPTL